MKRLFTVIDIKAGGEPDVEKIVLKEEWAKKLRGCDVDGLVLDNEGDLFLLDECGNYVWVPEGRFAVVFHNSDLDMARELLKESRRMLEKSNCVVLPNLIAAFLEEE
jgi:hypothetical protein